jgi:hypothetical protein
MSGHAYIYLGGPGLACGYVFWGEDPPRCCDKPIEEHMRVSSVYPPPSPCAKCDELFKQEEMNDHNGNLICDSCLSIIREM